GSPAHTFNSRNRSTRSSRVPACPGSGGTVYLSNAGLTGSGGGGTDPSQGLASIPTWSRYSATTPTPGPGHAWAFRLGPEFPDPGVTSRQSMAEGHAQQSEQGGGAVTQSTRYRADAGRCAG